MLSEVDAKMGVHRPFSSRGADAAMWCGWWGGADMAGGDGEEDQRLGKKIRKEGESFAFDKGFEETFTFYR